MAVNGKSKGSAFEREVCKKLSLWVSNWEREDCLWRSAMSGGRATVHRKRGVDLTQHAGDISATHPLGEALTSKWLIECKSYAKIGIEPFMLKNKGTLAGFWEKLLKEATHYKKRPMLIFKQNGSKVFVMVRSSDYLLLSPTLDHRRDYLVRLGAGRGVHIVELDKLVCRKFKCL